MSAEHRRAQILDIAWDLCRSKGFEAITMEQLAKSAGITRTVIYQNFGDLDGVLEALIERQYQLALDTFFKAVPVMSPSDDNPFLHIFAELLKAVDADPDNWSLLLRTPVGAPACLHKKIEEGRHITREVIARSLLTASFASHTSDTELNTHLMQVTAEELLRLRLEQPEKYSHERLLSQVRFMTREDTLGRHH